MDDVTTDAVSLLPIEKIGEKLGLSDQDLDPYGRYTAKITGSRQQTQLAMEN